MGSGLPGSRGRWGRGGGTLTAGARLLPRGGVGTVVLVGQGAPGRLRGAALRRFDAGRLRGLGTGRRGRRSPRHLGGGLTALLGEPETDQGRVERTGRVDGGCRGGVVPVLREAGQLPGDALEVGERRAAGGQRLLA